ncbi:putative AbiEi antitoxin of type IV toxin-antitoxin system [Sediminihabitans luteus]|uniref:Putative AbiEi antitoxin of type IV toxin-antitoxin system n=1 Tax=Sediminihabitans luteus TaxID=1138585 RepID=A0A2M9D0N9_9CELL|nr:type IV toxin-antitoxin system AbiEi family antitoxin domain-containing protein [Sediminihabitans luteus]PJJ77729.1 putative AbiEi antitoxin of type IV toxin-antitoxin system [Sediminihabitans luteus]GIJ00044.1 hypothetical protein Slu03_24210 [Sediminihabitans luteus]
MPTATEIPSTLHARAVTQQGLVSAGQVLASGISRRVLDRLVANGTWARVCRGVYDTVPSAPRDVDAGRRRVAWSALLAVGPEAVAVGPCALALLGVRGLPVHITPEAAVPGGAFRRDRGDVRVRRFDDGMRTCTVQGARVAEPRWALAQAVPELPRQHALAVLDDVLRRRVLDPRGVDLAHAVARGRRGVEARHDLWEWADARSESPLESFARLACIDGGTRPDTLQLVVRDERGRFVARGDMGWRLPGGRWLIAEIDGRDVHSTPEAVFADRQRQNAMLATGRVELLRFTSRDLPEAMPRAIRAALRTFRT